MLACPLSSLNVSVLSLPRSWTAYETNVGRRQWTYSPGCPSVLSLRVSFPWSEDWQTPVVSAERYSRNRKDAFCVEIPAQKHLRFKEAGAQPF